MMVALVPDVQTMGSLGLLAVMALVFVETGLLVGFFLPGDSLLFMTGVLTASGVIHVPIWAVVGGGFLAAAAGDQVGYLIGWHAGDRVFRKPQSRLFTPAHSRRAADLVERHGPRAVVLARFVPIARTFVPVVAGVGKMRYGVFLSMNLLGAAGWTATMISAGYYLGGIPFVVDHIELLTLGLVLASVLPLVGKSLMSTQRHSGAATAHRNASPQAHSVPTASIPHRGDMTTASGARTVPPGPRCLVVVPTYNEAETIERFLEEVLAATTDLGARVLVVDDSSPDGTGALVRKHPAFGSRVHLLSRASKDGLGAAYRAGFGWALAHGYDTVVQVDADGSHPVDRIPAMVVALDEHDLIIGSRYVAGGRTENWSARRRLLSSSANRYVRTVLGLRTHDATAGFRAWRASSLSDFGVLTTDSSGYCFQIECTWRAERGGARVVELPITFTERRAGASKMTGTVALEALVRVVQWRVREISSRTHSHRTAGASRAV